MQKNTVQAIYYIQCQFRLRCLDWKILKRNQWSVTYLGLVQRCLFIFQKKVSGVNYCSHNCTFKSKVNNYRTFFLLFFNVLK